MSHFDETSGIEACSTAWGRWWQTMEEVYVEMNLPEGTTSKQVKCTITVKSLTIVVNGTEVVKGDFPCAVKADESVWTIVKTTADQCWKCLLKGQYEPDPYTLDHMQKKLTLQRYQFENPGMDFSGAEITGNYHQGGPELPGT